MERHITDRQFAELESAVRSFGYGQMLCTNCVRRTAEVLNVSCYEAELLLQQHSLVEDLADSTGIEVHDEKRCSIPWFLDGQASAVLALICVGMVAVVCLACR